MVEFPSRPHPCCFFVQEDKQLIAAVGVAGVGNWVHISKLMKNTRSDSQVWYHDVNHFIIAIASHTTSECPLVFSPLETSCASRCVERVSRRPSQEWRSQVIEMLSSAVMPVYLYIIAQYTGESLALDYCVYYENTIEEGSGYLLGDISPLMDSS